MIIDVWISQSFIFWGYLIFYSLPIGFGVFDVEIKSVKIETVDFQ